MGCNLSKFDNCMVCYALWIIIVMLPPTSFSTTTCIVPMPGCAMYPTTRHRIDFLLTKHQRSPTKLTNSHPETSNSSLTV
jgi:hypothetical protein